MLALRERESVVASQATGASQWRIISVTSPRLSSPLIIAATLDVGWMTMFVAGLSLLGLGAQPPAPNGALCREGHKYIRIAPHASIVPGLAIFLVVLALNLWAMACAMRWTHV